MPKHVMSSVHGGKGSVWDVKSKLLGCNERIEDLLNLLKSILIILV